LASRVRDAIDKQVTDLNIKIASLNTDTVDWKQVVTASVFRHPPFEKGNKEKGFRDVLIVECLMQVIAGSPKSPSSCRIVMVTADGLLTQAVQTRIGGSTNIRIVPNLDALQGLINTFVANVTEEFVAGIQEAAKACFFLLGITRRTRDQRQGVATHLREVWG